MHSWLSRCGLGCARVGSGSLLAGAMVALALLPACRPQERAATTAATVTVPGTIRSVGMTVGDLSNPFFVQIAKGAEAKVRELGGAGVTFTAVSSGYDLNRQANQIDDFIAARTDLLLLNAADSRGIAPAVRKARAAGLTIIAIDVSAEGGVQGTVMSDNRQAGEMAGDYIGKRLKGTGSIVIINGPPVSAVLDRVAGLESALARFPGIRVLSRDQNGQGSRDGGMAVMTDLLVAHPGIEAVFAVNDPTALGAALALRQARKGGVFIAAVDGAPDAERALRDPDHPLAATAAQDPFAMAGRAVELGFALRSAQPPVETSIRIPVSLVTRETLSSYRGWTSQ
jgi:ribose transport system substrate-binding protein